MSSSQNEDIELQEIQTIETKPIVEVRAKIESVQSSPSKSSENSENVFLVQKRSKLSTRMSNLPPIPKPRLKSVKSPTSPRDQTSDDLSEISNASEYADNQSKSELISYREKIKSRFQSVKSSSRTKLLKERTNQDVISLNKSLDVMKKENVDVESRLKTHGKRERQESSAEVSAIEKYNFFCQCEPTKVVGDDDIVPVESDVGKSTDMLVEDFIVDYYKAQKCLEDVLASEKECLTYFSGKALNLSDKTGDGVKVLKEDDEYDTPKMRHSHLNILERRMLMCDKKWFNSDGQLHFVKNPIMKSSYRPPDHAIPSKLEIPFRKPYLNGAIDEPLEGITVLDTAIILINIHSIKFKHHPLFSAEHVLEQQLVEFYDKYREYESSNKLEKMMNKLKNLRKTKNQLEDTIQNTEGSVQQKIDLLEKYRKQINHLQENYLEHSKTYRRIIKNILYAWKSLKKIREVHNFTNTTIKLVIQKEFPDFDTEKADYEALIEDILNDELFVANMEYESNMKEYRKLKADYNADDADSCKPTKPSRVNVDDIRDDIIQNVADSLKTPGEPKLHFSLSYEHEISSDIDHSKEKLRRSAVISSKLSVRFLCNDLEICKTKTSNLDNSFTCCFDEGFFLKPNKFPENVTVEIYEQPTTLSKRKIGEIVLSIPKLDPEKIGNIEIKEEHFMKDELIHYKHTGIGSGVQLQKVLETYDLSDLELNENLITRGFITCSVSWQYVDSDAFQEFEENNLNILNDKGKIDIDKLSDWTETVNLDPDDPANTIIFDYIKQSQESRALATPMPDNCFRFDPNMKRLELQEDYNLDDNPRFKLLVLRDRNEPEFVGMVVPNRLKEIPTNIFSMYNRRMARENLEEQMAPDEAELEINRKRSQGRKFLRQVHTKVFQLCRNTAYNLRYEDVVNENTVTVIETCVRTIVFNFLNWFRWRRHKNKSLPPLQTVKYDRNFENASAPRICISIKNGINLPVRKVFDGSTTRKSSRKTDGKDEIIDHKAILLVRPFLEVHYLNTNLKTGIGEGKNPIWNETLTIPLESTSTDYLSPNALNGSIEINLFDEVLQNDSEYDIVWLGKVQIPISAICHNDKLDGLFLVKTPKVLLGYEQDLDQPASKELKQSNTCLAGTYLNISIRVQPHVPQLSPDLESLPCNEPPYLRNHILNWNYKYNIRQPNKKFSALAIDSNGKTTCLTRFIKSLEPPQIINDGFNVLPEQCAKYISLVPFTDSNHFYQNIWLSTEQFLKNACGSIIDHTVALTCFFLTLNLDAWLVLGFGIPNGVMSFVLVRELSKDTLLPKYFIYDVITARKYSISDTYCPLQRVFCVVNENNIWANLQTNNNISVLRFDFSRRFDWSPLFTNDVSAPTNSIQQKLLYVTGFDLQHLEYTIDKKIRKKIMKLRELTVTTWNNEVSKLFKNLMTRLETNPKFDYISEINELNLSYKINGFVVNLPFQSIISTMQFIQNTGIYMDQHENSEFSLAVHIHPYPNQILSVWITFIMLRKRNIT